MITLAIECHGKMCAESPLAISPQVTIPINRRTRYRIAAAIAAERIRIPRQHVWMGAADEIAEILIGNLATVVVVVEDCVRKIRADVVEPINQARALRVVN